MVTALLILAAVVVILALVIVVGQMCESGSMWFFYMICGTPTALLELLGVIIGAIFSQNE